MNIEKKLVAESQRLFDVAGVTAHGKDSLLILGLVTTPHQDLDDFLRDEAGVFRLHGFEVHAQPKLNLLVHFIREQGMAAEIWGPCGYPRGEELNLKQQAVAAGLGRWGKNSLVLNPRFGPWLRLMAVKVAGATLSPTGPGRDTREENPLCEDCTACIDACPLGILEPYYLRDRSSCRANIRKSSQMGKLMICNGCLDICPVGQR